jgi:demethylmenaquinone methyltransferase / 2-methoxy-6-polyprenyl-1,4-benzoquinol methylase
MFDRIAARYDLVNRVISLGLDQGWRRRTIAALHLVPGIQVLDLATGTGDLALEIARREPGARVVGLDPSEGMLAVGRRKLLLAKVADRVELIAGDAQALPFEDEAFDGVCMAFGIRNVPDRGLALREITRVLRPGGRVAILELTDPRRGPLAAMARFHVHQVVPRLGAWLSGAGEYRYLERSIAAFPPAEAFAELMGESGLVPDNPVSFTFGVAHLFAATRPGGARK